jgi:hypothetical protein
MKGTPQQEKFKQLHHNFKNENSAQKISMGLFLFLFVSFLNNWIASIKIVDIVFISTPINE